MRKIFIALCMVALCNGAVFAGRRDDSGYNPSSSAHDQPVASYNPESSPYDPKNSPYNPENSPYNWNNSPYNPANSPYNPENSAYNPNNSPYNPENSPYNPTRATGPYDENIKGYTVPRAGGGLNIFDENGNLVGYTTEAGEVHSIAEYAGSATLSQKNILANSSIEEKREGNITEDDSAIEDAYRSVRDRVPGLDWNLSQ